MAYYIKIGESSLDVFQDATSQVETEDFERQDEQEHHLSPGNYLLFDEDTLERVKQSSAFFDKYLTPTAIVFTEDILKEFHDDHSTHELDQDDSWSVFMGQVYEWAELSFNIALDNCKAPAIVAE